MEILTWKARYSRKITLVDLASKSGVCKSTLNNIENGKTSPTMDQMERIAKALDMRIGDLYESKYK